MFNGFELRHWTTSHGVVRGRVGGNGPPLLLLHGNPQTHAMWHHVAPALTERFTVVATDLTGYGGTFKPPSTPGHSPYSKRAMAATQIEVMTQLGFNQFDVAGHDRGGRVAYRMALDHPEVVRRLAVLDIIPTGDSFAHGGKDFAFGYYHWFFLAQPAPLPETLINADPRWWWRWHTSRGQGEIFAPAALDDYLTCFSNPETVRGMCEDYRAGIGIDCELDAADRQAGRRIQCPVLVLWGARAKLQAWYDTLAQWREWADNVQGGSLDCGHYLAEERPQETLAQFLTFFADATNSPSR